MSCLFPSLRDEGLGSSLRLCVKLPFKRKVPTLAKFLPQSTQRHTQRATKSIFQNSNSDFIKNPDALRGTSFLDTSNFYPMPIPISPIPLAIAEF